MSIIHVNLEFFKCYYSLHYHAFQIHHPLITPFFLWLPVQLTLIHYFIHPYSMTRTFLNLGVPALIVSNAFLISDRGYLSIMHLIPFICAKRIASSESRA